jgi:dolichol-phosphate mannosyltransferase
MPEPLPIPDFSVVVPFFNEEAIAAEVIAELVAALEARRLTWEAILVDDGSGDRTAEVLSDAGRRWPGCRVVRLSQNQGQGAALFRGIQAARAPVIGMMDGDGQNMPADFAQLLPLLAAADMVVGVRARRDDSRLRRALSRVANTVRGTLLRDGVSDAGCALKVFRREVAATFWPFRMLNPFMPALAVASGFRVVERPVGHRPRLTGVSKYRLAALLGRPVYDLVAIWWLLRARRKRSPVSP